MSLPEFNKTKSSLDKNKEKAIEEFTKEYDKNKIITLQIEIGDDKIKKQFKTSSTLSEVIVWYDSIQSDRKSLISILK